MKSNKIYENGLDSQLGILIYGTNSTKPLKNKSYVKKRKLHEG